MKASLIILISLSAITAISYAIAAINKSPANSIRKLALTLILVISPTSTPATADPASWTFIGINNENEKWYARDLIKITDDIYELKSGFTKAGLPVKLEDTIHPIRIDIKYHTASYDADFNTWTSLTTELALKYETYVLLELINSHKHVEEEKRKRIEACQSWPFIQ